MLCGMQWLAGPQLDVHVFLRGCGDVGRCGAQLALLGFGKRDHDHQRSSPAVPSVWHRGKHRSDRLWKVSVLVFNLGHSSYLLCVATTGTQSLLLQQHVSILFGDGECAVLSVVGLPGMTLAVFHWNMNESSSQQ